MKPILPFPPNQGTKRVTLQILKNLAQEHEIVLFTRLLTREEEPQVRALETEIPNLRVVAVLAPNRRSLGHRIYYGIWTRLRGTGNIPPVESYTALPTLVRAFHRLLETEEPDLVVAEYWYSQEYLCGVQVPCVLFAHDMEFHVREHAKNMSRESGRSATWGDLEVKREKKALREAQNLWVLTEGDKALAVEIGCDSQRVNVLPYGVDGVSALRPRCSEDPQPRPKSVFLFGAFQADFNRDALRFTLDSIFPELLKLQPEAVLRVGGSGLDETLRSLCDRPGVTVEGEVQNVRSALLRAEVILIPLRFGGGLRIRLLEALALECAVVGTPTGVLGMGVHEDTEVLVGKTPQELAGQIARAMEDPGLRRQLGTQGRRTVMARHDQGASARIQRDLVRSLIS